MCAERNAGDCKRKGDEVDDDGDGDDDDNDDDDVARKALLFEL